MEEIYRLLYEHYRDEVKRCNKDIEILNKRFTIVNSIEINYIFTALKTLTGDKVEAEKQREKFFELYKKVKE